MSSLNCFLPSHLSRTACESLFWASITARSAARSEYMFNIVWQFELTESCITLLCVQVPMHLPFINKPSITNYTKIGATYTCRRLVHQSAEPHRPKTAKTSRIECLLQQKAKSSHLQATSWSSVFLRGWTTTKHCLEMIWHSISFCLCYVVRSLVELHTPRNNAVLMPWSRELTFFCLFAVGVFQPTVGVRDAGPMDCFGVVWPFYVRIFFGQHIQAARWRACIHVTECVRNASCCTAIRWQLLHGILRSIGLDLWVRFWAHLCHWDSDPRLWWIC